MAKVKSKRKGRINEEKASQWKAVIAEQKSSGESISAYCEAKGLSMQSFFYWRKRMRKARRSKVEETAVEAAPKRAKAAKRASSSSSAQHGMVSVEFPNGAIIRLSDTSDAQTIRDLIMAAAEVASNGHK